MIISRTPFRISFFGGGTDYPAWVEKHGGAVLSTTFDKYSYITCRVLPPFFDHRHRITYSRVEHVREADEVEHPAIRAALRHYCGGGGDGVEIHCDADLPARSGLGSSSAFMVGLLHTLEALQGRRATPEWLAREAIRYEQEVLGETVGYQDQVAAAFGGFNLIQFLPGGGFKVEPMVLPRERKEELEKRLLLFFTGFSRTASEVAKSQVANMGRKEKELARMRAMVDEALEILYSGRGLAAFGELLHQGWLYKRSLSNQVTNPEVDAIYERARQAGALGGKLLGAGGGGFILFFAEPDRQTAVRQALAKLIHVPVRFENDGSRIIWHRE
jgi:D-glycero-alpha-D-manno-heptose-7-phosphate kinase